MKQTANPAIRLAAFDMEGCLTADPTAWEIMHRKLGTWESHGEPYWRRYCAHEFDYDTFARMDVAVWRGAPLTLLAEASAAVPLMPGCAETLRALAVAGIEVAIISNGLERVARRFADEFGVRRIFANGVAKRNGALTGEIDIRVPYAEKGRVLAAIMAEMGLAREEVAAVGDSVSDIAMFEQARIGVAFCTRHADVAAAATHRLDRADLRPLLAIVGA